MLDGAVPAQMAAFMVLLRVKAWSRCWTDFLKLYGLHGISTVEWRYWHSARALRQGETGEEVASIARTMRLRSVPVDAGVDTLDIVGTGGDGIGSVNISTGACVLAAASGARVAKHGSRSVSSLCGSADVLEVLIPIHCFSRSAC